MLCLSVWVAPPDPQPRKAPTMKRCRRPEPPQPPQGTRPLSAQLWLRFPPRNSQRLSPQMPRKRGSVAKFPERYGTTGKSERQNGPGWWCAAAGQSTADKNDSTYKTVSATLLQFYDFNLRRFYAHGHTVSVFPKRFRDGDFPLSIWGTRGANHFQRLPSCFTSLLAYRRREATASEVVSRRTISVKSRL